MTRTRRERPSIDVSFMVGGEVETTVRRYATEGNRSTMSIEAREPGEASSSVTLFFASLDEMEATVDALKAGIRKVKRSVTRPGATSARQTLSSPVRLVARTEA